MDEMLWYCVDDNDNVGNVNEMMLLEWLNKLEYDLLNVELVCLNDDECCWYMIIRVGFWMIRWWINGKWVIDGVKTLIFMWGLKWGMDKLNYVRRI